MFLWNFRKTESIDSRKTFEKIAVLTFCHKVFPAKAGNVLR